MVPIFNLNYLSCMFLDIAHFETTTTKSQLFSNDWRLCYLTCCLAFPGSLPLCLLPPPPHLLWKLAAAKADDSTASDDGAEDYSTAAATGNGTEDDAAAKDGSIPDDAIIPAAAETIATVIKCSICGNPLKGHLYPYQGENCQHPANNAAVKEKAQTRTDICS